MIDVAKRYRLQLPRCSREDCCVRLAQGFDVLLNRSDVQDNGEPFSAYRVRALAVALVLLTVLCWQLSKTRVTGAGASQRGATRRRVCRVSETVI